MKPEAVLEEVIGSMVAAGVRRRDIAAAMGIDADAGRVPLPQAKKHHALRRALFVGLLQRGLSRPKIAAVCGIDKGTVIDHLANAVEAMTPRRLAQFRADCVRVGTIAAEVGVPNAALVEAFTKRYSGSFSHLPALVAVRLRVWTALRAEGLSWGRIAAATDASTSTVYFRVGEAKRRGEAWKQIGMRATG